MKVSFLLIASVAAADSGIPPTPLESFANLPYPILVLIVILATFVSEDLTCISAGLLVANGSLSFMPAVFACFLGIFIGDGLLFLAGRLLGRPALQYPPLRWLVHPADIQRSTDWFRRHGSAIVFMSRFLPGTRFATYVAAGLLDMHFLTFATFFALAGVIWTPILVGASALLGHGILPYLELYRSLALPIFIGIAVCLLILFRLVFPLFTHRGRRLLLSRWRRITRWEFWSPWIFYAPMIPYLLYLGFKHRSLTAFTAANPALPAGGFIGESKSRILRALSPRGDRVAAHAIIPGNLPLPQRMTLLRQAMKEIGFSFPIVLKPDVGQRGTGVAFPENESDASKILERDSGDLIAQAFAPGEEFGVFYYRYPGEKHGHILSITEKKFPHVVGDGEKNLERLILDDDRAVCMAKFHLRALGNRLFDIPTENERVQLVQVGTHCRGAVFLNGEEIETPELLLAIDEISRSYDGFYFGRYDIRTPSVEEFQAGRNFKIVELNGVTSEATHIYAPGSSLRNAYRDLRNQWRIAYEIGARNIEDGAATTPLRNLLAMTLQFRRGSRHQQLADCTDNLL